MKIKPHIFIGSSSEGFPAAQVLKARLSLWANCDIWKDPGVFELNKGYLENLLERLNLYEYGIMVATGDDATKSRGETKMALSRDARARSDCASRWARSFPTCRSSS